MMKTDQALCEMLLENTGAHLLDSGGAYGRGWERAQKAVEGYDDPLDYFYAQPPTTLSFSCVMSARNNECRPDVSHNTFHWLNEQLGDYLEEETREFWEWSDAPEQEDLYWPDLMEKWADTYFWSADRACTANTYNGENLVADTLQFCGGRDKVLLQIHRGCDVRGGYTSPRIFECPDGLWRVAEGCIWAEPKTPDADPQMEKLLDVEPIVVCPPRWWTDDGWNWYADSGDGADNLHKYMMTDDESKRGDGFVYVDEDRNGYCPVTGTLLRAGF